MKRLLALLVALGVLVLAAPGVDLARADDEKKEEKKKDDKKDEKKADEKKADEKKATKKEELSSAQKEELKRLSGTFTVATYEREGKKATPDELKKMKVIQKGAEWSFHLGDEVTTGKDTPHPDKDPKEIDSVYTNGPDRDKTVKGLYKIDNDTITYAWAEPGKDRPKELKADANTTLMVLKRVSEKTEEKKEGKKEEKKDSK